MEINTHILSTFNKDLATLKEHLAQLVETVDKSLENALVALKTGDTNLCKQIIAEDDLIDTQHRLIDALAMNTLVRYNPMASDLRFIVSSISIAKNLERIGDHTVEIAGNAKKIYRKKSAEDSNLDVEYVTDLYEMAISQFKLAKEAILNVDIKQACLLYTSDAADD